MGNLADLAIGVSADTSGIESAMDDAASSVEDFEGTTGRVGAFVEDNFMKMGAAAAGIGAGLEGFARSQQASNVGFERMGRVTGEGADKMRDMATSLQNVTFPMEDVTALMETATQRGLEGDAIAEYATFWDKVGDATGEAGPALAEAGVALGLVGISAGEEAEALDAFGYITDQTTGSVEEFLGFIEKTGTELGDATPTVDEMAGALGALEDQGLSSQRAQRELRTALSETDGDMAAALETLGVSEEAYQEQIAAVEGSAGAIDANAQALADSFTPMQKMSARLENVMTKYGGLASAAGAVSAPLAGAGSAMMGVSMVAPKLVTKIGTLVSAIGTKIAAITSWAAATVAQGARALGSMAITSAQFIAHYTRMAVASLAQAARMAASWVIAMGPVGWVIAAIVGLVAVIVANWDTVKKWTGKIWDWVGDKIEAVGTWINDTVRGMVDKVVGFFTDLKDRAIQIVTTMVTGYIRFITNLRDRIVSIATTIRDKVVGFFTFLRDKVIATVSLLKDRVVKFFGDVRDRVVGIASKIKEKVVEFFGGLKDSVVEKITDMIDRVKGIKDDILGFFSGAGTWLVDAGRNVIQGIIDGIGAMIGKLGSKMSEVTSKVRDFLPFSPAKEGPLSGRGSPDIAGAKLVSMIGDGMGGQLGTLAKMADATAAAALPSLMGPDVPSMGMPRVGRMGGASAGALRPIVLEMDSREMARVLVDPLSGEVQRRSWHTAGASPW